MSYSDQAIFRRGSRSKTGRISEPQYHDMGMPQYSESGTEKLFDFVMYCSLRKSIV